MDEIKEKIKRVRRFTPEQREVNRIRGREYYALNREKISEYNKKHHKEYYKNNIERILRQAKNSRDKRFSDPVKREAKNRKQHEYYMLHRDDKARAYQRGREKNKAERQRIKWEVLTHYSGNPPSCACCGESIYDFLCLDHINGGGNQHRTKIRKFGNLFYHWIFVNNFPDGFQILCFNCNMAKGFFGSCPHKRSEYVSKAFPETKKD